MDFGRILKDVRYWRATVVAPAKSLGAENGDVLGEVTQYSESEIKSSN